MTLRTWRRDAVGVRNSLAPPRYPGRGWMALPIGSRDRYGQPSDCRGAEPSKEPRVRVPPRKSAVPVLVTVLAALASLLVATAPAAQADGPGAGAPWLVSVGDSYISGEAGRWAGSSNSSSSYADALGAAAYSTTPRAPPSRSTAATAARPPRSYVGGGVNGLNLACSGAKTSTYTTSEGYFKPGLDFADDGAGHLGQAKLLQQFATTHNVRMVAVSIGGNDFNFGSIVQQCVTDFLGSPSWFKDYCNDDSSVTANFTSRQRRGGPQPDRHGLRQRPAGDAQRRLRRHGLDDAGAELRVAAARRRRRSATRRAATPGRAPAAAASGTPTPTGPTPPRCRRSTAPSPARSAPPGITNAKTLDLSSAFNGRRLCESTVGLYEEKGLTSWTQAGAVDRTEWVNQIRTVSTAGQQPVLRPGVAAPELLGAAGDPVLRPAGLQRRYAARRHLLDRGTGLRERRAPDDPAVAGRSPALSARTQGGLSPSALMPGTAPVG